MGWSCSSEAAKTRDRWTELCLSQTNQQNVFESNGDRYFFETSNVEHADGAITGEIWKFVGEDKARKTGTFRIDGYGKVIRGPKVLKDAVA